MPMTVYTKADIEEEREKQEQIEQSITDVQATLDELESVKNDTTAYITEMDAKLTEIATNIQSLNEQSQAKQLEIDATNSQLELQQEELDRQYDLMKKRIQFMYENGDSQMLDLLFGSESISDFLNKAEYIKTLTDYDRKAIQELKDAKQAVEDSKTQLETEQAELQTLTDTALAEQSSMETLVAAKEEELRKTEAEISSAEQDIITKQKALEEQAALVSQMEAVEERRRQQEAAAKAAAEDAARRASEAGNNTDSSNSSTDSNNNSSSDIEYNTSEATSFIWPLNGYYTISSDYSDRISPISGKSEMHNGIDIPAPIGTPIYAVADGTVDWAWTSSSAGNWMGIAHGNGLYSVYMHMSAFAVSSGTYVKQGQIIGYVGSTGWSTGAHLHLTFRLNGSYVNPHIYVG